MQIEALLAFPMQENEEKYNTTL